MTQVDNSCLDGIIGLANCACPCLEGTAPTGWDESNSGLFIADLIPMSMLEGADDCSDPENPWNLLHNGFEQGGNQLMKDLRAGLMKKNQLIRTAFRGVIGEKQSRDVLTLSTTYAGVRVSSPQIRGGYLRASAIGGIFNATGPIAVSCYNRFNALVGGPWTINTVAGVWSSTSITLSLPLWVDGAENPEYFFSYTVNQNNLPRANRLWCPGCAKESIPTFSIEKPYYMRTWRGPQSWANWAMVGAWSGNSLTDFDLLSDETMTGSGMNGLTISCEFSCDPATAVCLDDLDFSDPVALSFAHAFRYIAAINVAEKIIRNPAPYRNAAVSKEILAVDIQQWYKDYQTNLDYVLYNVNQNASDCIFCKPTFSLSLQSKLP